MMLTGFPTRMRWLVYKDGVPSPAQALAAGAADFLRFEESKRDWSMRFETWIVPSRSAIFPCGFSWDFLRWRLIMATPSTTARFLAARTSRTLPDLPLWEPAMTTTWSLRLM